MSRAALVTLALVGACKGNDDTSTPATPTTTVQDTTPPAFPLPDDLDTIDFVSAYRDAMSLAVSVTTQQPWLGHTDSITGRGPGCPDFWTGQITDTAGQLIGNDFGLSWYDDCQTSLGAEFDGWIWWDFDVIEAGDPTTQEGMTSDATRTIEGDAFVSDLSGVVFEFDGTATDSFYNVEASGYSRFTYSSTVDATVTGTAPFGTDSLTPEGYRSDLFLFLSGGDVDAFEARGNVYLFTPQLHDRFDSVEVDLAFTGPESAEPGSCTLEPLGWIGLRDENALWYDVVFQPRFEDDIVGDPYPNDPRSTCDGCGHLYVQGIAQDIEVCMDFTFLFDGLTVPLPNPDDYVLPLHAL
jgi:hypothetical protein